MTTFLPVTDLTQRPPRGFRVRIGGLVILARMLDKGRATLAGKNGEYEYLTSIDEHLVRFLGFDPDALLKELATGKGDWEILQWIQANCKTPRQLWEIEAFSSSMERYAPDSDPETLAVFADYFKNFPKGREDLKTWFEVLELDDYVSYGGMHNVVNSKRVSSSPRRRECCLGHHGKSRVGRSVIPTASHRRGQSPCSDLGRPVPRGVRVHHQVV
jgi:Domain of unknown function (DUF5069)